MEGGGEMVKAGPAKRTPPSPSRRCAGPGRAERASDDDDDDDAESAPLWAAEAEAGRATCTTRGAASAALEALPLEALPACDVATATGPAAPLARALRSRLTTTTADLDRDRPAGAGTDDAAGAGPSDIGKNGIRSCSYRQECDENE